MDQILLALLGVIAVALTQSEKEGVRKYAPLFGLSAQPLWLMTALEVQKWGMFFMVALYTILWAIGFWRQLLRPWLVRGRSCQELKQGRQ